MKKQDLEFLLETLNYGLNDCEDKNGNPETHFNSFANAINVVQDELNLLDRHIVSNLTYSENCNVYIDTKTDEWVFDYKGVTKKRAKSKFECLLTKKALQKELGV
ncbi:MAG: hypothetical protein GF317_23275 [Candidatus Lokiarchaeota archaeon]|nr:hypothetical protein [Candidatus Lokiarchaeota archaeon]